MKPNTKPITKREKKKHISLVLPEKATPSDMRSAPTQPAPAAPKADLATAIADELGETEPGPRNQIRHIVWALGHDQALNLTLRAQQIKANGEMPAAPGDRQRTAGEIFFHLAYTEGKPREGRTLIRPE